ncbi:MAG TPA: tRNA (adenosine(37)-N6)-threonylcarbamoyltransferase complex ATPase subunit type 1 TsaE [Candidatus Tyrphobacter sp.]|nr:tRNA (adenosine(37)-N6)-threonylcarbamoyltransferase complex ATPase subunit type 1 TsaE [Candidatus Tyrphobacter sp.]
MKILSRSEKETKKLARFLAEEVLKTGLSQKALVFGLEGDLGAGKTSFIKGFAAALGIKKITSPTFLIERRFRISPSLHAPFRHLYHLDAYRLKSEKELAGLGFTELVAEPRNIILIEWADRVPKLLPPRTLKLKFSHGRGEGERLIEFSLPKK